MSFISKNLNSKFIYRLLDPFDHTWADYRPEDESPKSCNINRAKSFLNEAPEIEDFDQEYGSTSILDVAYLPPLIADENGNISSEKYINWLENRFKFCLTNGEQEPLIAPNRQVLHQIVADAMEYQSMLGISPPKPITNSINELLAAIAVGKNIRTALIALLSKAQSFDAKNKNTPYTCAFLKILSVSLNFHLAEGLKDLPNKTKTFSSTLISKLGISSINNEDELAKTFDKRNVRVSSQNPVFTLTDLHFRGKDKWSIFNKLLRKSQSSAEGIIKDGVSARMVLKLGKNSKETEDNFNGCKKWLEEQGFTVKAGHENITHGEGKNDDVYFIKTLEDGTPCEVQVTTDRGLKKAESGIADHRIYKLKAQLLIYVRLFGSINDNFFRELIRKVVSEINHGGVNRVNALDVEAELKRLFFPIHTAGQKKPRWSSYDFVSKQIRTQNLPAKYYETLYKSLARDITNDEMIDLTLNDVEWQGIFEDRIFPIRFKTNPEAQKKIIEFLTSKVKGKKGIPPSLIAYLRLQHLATLTSSDKVNTPPINPESKTLLSCYDLDTLRSDLKSPNTIEDPTRFLNFLKAYKERFSPSKDKGLAFLMTYFETKVNSAKVIAAQ